jgi:hypothetical protein
LVAGLNPKTNVPPGRGGTMRILLEPISLSIQQK